VRIERLRWWHIEDVLPIEAALFGAQQWTAAMFWSELANGHYYIGAFVESAAFVESTPAPSELVGYAGMAIGPPEEAWINNIAVRADHQRGGIGRALLLHLLDQAGARGATQTLLEVAADNAAAQRLYDEQGFEVVGVRRGYYQPGNTDALVMRRRNPVVPT
jgi:ribosomal-protein-alanine N-acetyltransferase